MFDHRNFFSGFLPALMLDALTKSDGVLRSCSIERSVLFLKYSSVDKILKEMPNTFFSFVKKKQGFTMLPKLTTSLGYSLTAS